MEFFDPFHTFYRDNQDFNQSDALNEARLLIQRQNAIIDVVEGHGYADVVLDLLEGQGIDPVGYVRAVEQAVDDVIKGNFVVEPWLL